MGWGTLPAPGTKLGPCATPCNHVDCVLTRKDAEVKCQKCGELHQWHGRDETDRNCLSCRSREWDHEGDWRPGR